MEKSISEVRNSVGKDWKSVDGALHRWCAFCQEWHRWSSLKLAGESNFDGEVMELRSCTKQKAVPTYGLIIAPHPKDEVSKAIFEVLEEIRNG